MAISIIVKNTQISIGDTVKVKQGFVVENKPQTQSFQGIVISIKGRKPGTTFTVRKISADSIGVEKIWPVDSPSIIKVTLIKSGNTRRAKLYFLKNRIGKTALKVKSDKTKVVK
ncbi:MAG: 50S ribosomal protein L19 [Candidatus Beckwithbacteria bacterium]